MTNDLEALARRAVASHHFRWMPGMVTETGIRVLRRDTDGYTIGYGPRTSYCIMEVTSDALPDLSDPATMGCLLALVREAWGDDEAYASNYGGFDSITWAVTSPLWDHKRNKEAPQPWFSCMIGHGQTEAAALVSALREAAP